MSCCPPKKELVPHPSEYEELSFSLKDSMLSYMFFYVFVFLPLVFVHQETIRPGASLNTWIKINVYGQKPLNDFMADNHLDYHWDDKTPICDFRTMTPK